MVSILKIKVDGQVSEVSEAFHLCRSTVKLLHKVLVFATIKIILEEIKPFHEKYNYFL